MKKLDLITGFLGSGKTTFIIEYANYLIRCGKRVAVLVNDRGAINVDRLLYEENLPGCHIEMVIGGDADCLRRRLKTKLIALGMDEYDHILLEPSGVFDADEFFDLLYEEPLDRFYQIGNVITLVDGTMPVDLSKETRYLLASQISNAGAVVVSRPEGVNENEFIARLNQTIREFSGDRKLTSVYLWERGKITEEDFVKLSSCGYFAGNLVKLPVAEGEHFRSLFFFHAELSPERLNETFAKLFHDADTYGTVLRVKGYLQTKEGWLCVNATKDRIELEPSTVGQEVLIVIGEDLNEEKISACWESFHNE